MALTKRIGASVAAATSILVLTLAAPVLAYHAENVRDAGRIVGIVKYRGPAPTQREVEISKDREVCGRRPLYDESLVVGKGSGLANAVVSIANIAAGEPLKPGRDLKFDQRGCEYRPRVLAFPAGSTIDIINSDGILHNIHTESRINPTVDMAQPGFKKIIKLAVAKPEAIKVTCDAHNWMVGWWYVTDNPYYAVTDRSGGFSISDVPPGTYSLRVWQETLGTVSQTVRVKPGATTTTVFTMTAPKAPGMPHD